MTSTEKLRGRTITVGLCTYKRPHVLETLRSIESQKGLASETIQIVVVDNDVEQSGRKYVETFAKETGVLVDYVSEPAKNIAAARNAVLENSKGLWIAFIDDDELAEPDWLQNLLITADRFNATAVIGRVISIYPSNTPRWITEGGYFDRTDKSTGSRLEHGNTGCALINAEYLRDKGIRFDPRFGLTGGEDSDLFFRVHKTGGRIVWCNEARVTEPVESNRLNAKYLSIKALRGGQTWIAFQRPFFDKKMLAKVWLKTFAKVLGNAPLLIVLLPFGPRFYMRPWLKIVDGFGKATALMGTRQVEIYKLVEPENAH